LVELFARWQDELLGALVCLLGNLEDARDALQEAFIKCWRHREKLPEIEQPKAWIFQIALNAGRDLRSTAWRRKRRPLEGDATMLLIERTAAADGASPAARMEQAEELARVRHAVAALRSEEQEVLLLRQNAQMSYEEIARSLEIPIGTVKSRMRRALSRLRVALAAPEDREKSSPGDEARDSLSLDGRGPG
jgi:RNA polymerase sigma factor (sigma-70 family)